MNTVPQAPPTTAEIATAASHIAATGARLLHMSRVAWVVSRTVGPDVEADQRRVRGELAQARGDRKAIRRTMSEAANALSEFRVAVRNANDARIRGQSLLAEQRQRLDDIRTAKTVDGADAAVALADDIARLHVPLADLMTALEEATLREHLIEVSLLRRIHTSCLVAILSQVEQISAQLGALKAEVEAVHARATTPDEIVATGLALLDFLKSPPVSLPSITWPKWSSAGSKNPKSNWVGDMFAEPQITPPNPAG